MEKWEVFKGWEKANYNVGMDKALETGTMLEGH